MSIFHNVIYSWHFRHLPTTDGFGLQKLKIKITQSKTNAHKLKKIYVIKICYKAIKKNMYRLLYM